MERGIREVERLANGLDEITKSADAIDGHVNRILDRARIMRNGLGATSRHPGRAGERIEGALERRRPIG